MNASDLKRLAKLSEWKELVADCRSSGLKVREWCEKQGICYQTYYRWEKLVLAEASGKLQTQNQLPMNAQKYPAPVFAEIPSTSSIISVQHSEEAIATIRYGEVSIDLYAGTDPRFIVSLCKELNHAQ